MSGLRRIERRPSLAMERHGVFGGYRPFATVRANDDRPVEHVDEGVVPP